MRRASLSGWITTVVSWRRPLRFRHPPPCSVCLAMRQIGRIRNAGDRALLGAWRAARERLHHLAGALRIGDPLGVEVVRTVGDAVGCFARIDLAGVPAMK